MSVDTSTTLEMSQQLNLVQTLMMYPNILVYYQIPAKLQTSVGLEPLKAEDKSLNLVGFITYFHSQLGAMQI